jgi:glycosyltransferase involved in cell wall biosynthesis
MNKENLRIGYVPMSNTLDSPGDRRRFVAYAHARNLKFTLAKPEERYDLVVLSQMADISVWCDYPHGKVVYDFIDSYLAIPRTNIKQWLRGIVMYAVGRHRRLRFDYRATLQNMCRRADAIICSTKEQAGDIKPFCQNVHLVLDVQKSVVNRVKENYSSDLPFNLVWEGLPSNISQLNQIQDVLKDLDKHRPLILNIVTDPERPRLLGRFGRIFGRIQSIDLARKVFNSVKLHIWDESTCSDIIRNCDLAVIPIDLSDPFAFGKPENKLLLFWRMGMPVVTSATPAYLQAMQAVGSEDLACESKKEWLTAIERMMNDETLRHDAGQAGKEYADSYYGEEVLLARWDVMFSSIGFSFNKDV